ncbi:hypothetical protein [Halovenus salina]|uniref:Uncharacterized protein n=1 Tax=Halovenus salina TaxID=1510225 RepID=A0ABD5W400_9EURY
MLLIGSDDGLYRLRQLERDGDTTATQVHETGRVRRIQTFDGIDGVFAATETGLYRSLDGTHWEDLAVPVENVYAVGARAEDRTLFAGTRPAHLFETTVDDDAGWHEVDPFRDRPSGEEWQVSRHDDRAQVRDVHVAPGDSERVVAGVEVGGVHVSDDGGATWEAREGVTATSTSCVFSTPRPSSSRRGSVCSRPTTRGVTGGGSTRSSHSGTSARFRRSETRSMQPARFETLRRGTTGAPTPSCSSRRT